MSVDTILALLGVGAVFAFFAAILAYGDATWSKSGGQRS